MANVSRARNYGASKAEGEILLFLDADTTLEPSTIHSIRHNFNDGHSVGTTKSKADEDLLKFKLMMGFKNFYNSTGLYKGCSGALICRRKAFDAVDGYDPTLAVKEHRKLLTKLIKHGNYTCVPTHVTTSMRRFKQWGVLKATLFWVGQWMKDKVGDLQDSTYEKIR